MIKNYQNLRIWQSAKDLTVSIYKITNKQLFSKDYSLKDQIRRSSVSVVSNIAEGYERDNNNELIQFLRISKASACELETQLIIAKEINYLGEFEFLILSKKITDLINQIGKFLGYMQKYKKSLAR